MFLYAWRWRRRATTRRWRRPGPTLSSPSSFRYTASTASKEDSIYVGRVQSCVLRLHPASVSSPRNKGGGYTLAGRRGGWGGSIFWKTKDIGLASYSNNLSTTASNANEGPVRIQYKCLVPIYVFPEMKLRALVTIFPKQNYNVLSPNFNFHTHVSQWAIYIFPGSVYQFCSNKIARLILGIYKSLIDKWM